MTTCMFQLLTPLFKVSCYQNVPSGCEIEPNTSANATKFFTLVTKS